MHGTKLVSANRNAWRRLARILCLTMLGISFHALAQAMSYDVVIDSTSVGQVTVDSLDYGMYGGFTSAYGSPASLDAAAVLGGADHFNWFQVIVADNDPLNDMHGMQLAPPYLDPALGGYGAPDLHWADGLPWLWDEGSDPPNGTPGFEDGYNLEDDVMQDVDPVDGFADTLLFDDFPGGPAGSAVTFQTWLVSVDADGSLEEFHGGFEWSWSNPFGGDGESEVLPQPLAPVEGLSLYQLLVFPDFNRDDTIDAADYTAWRNNLGTVYTEAHYDAWRSHYGETADSGSGGIANAVVPEPATALMLLVGLLATGWRGRTPTG